MSVFKAVSLDIDVAFEIQRSLRAMGIEEHHVLADKVGEAIRASITSGMDVIEAKYADKGSV